MFARRSRRANDAPHAHGDDCARRFVSHFCNAFGDKHFYSFLVCRDASPASAQRTRRADASPNPPWIATPIRSS